MGHPQPVRLCPEQPRDPASVRPHPPGMHRVGPAEHPERPSGKVIPTPYGISQLIRQVHLRGQYDLRVLPGYVLIPGGIEECQDGCGTGRRGHRGPFDHPAGQLPPELVRTPARRPQVAQPGPRRRRPQFPQLHRLHRSHRRHRADRGDGRGEVLAGTVLVPGYLPAADRRELRHPGRFPVHAAEGLPEHR